MITVTISRTADHTIAAESRHRSLQPFDAVEKAIRKAWGKGATLNIDSSISLPHIGVWYGQIVRPGGSCITGVMRFATEQRVENGWSLKSGAGHYFVYQAGPNAYRVVHGGDVIGYYSQFGEANADAGRMYELSKGR